MRRGYCVAGHIFAETIEGIGKESDGWEEDDARTEDPDTVLIYRLRHLIANA